MCVYVWLVLLQLLAQRLFLRLKALDRCEVSSLRARVSGFQGLEAVMHVCVCVNVKYIYMIRSALSLPIQSHTHTRTQTYTRTNTRIIPICKHHNQRWWGIRVKHRRPYAFRASLFAQLSFFQDDLVHFHAHAVQAVCVIELKVLYEYTHIYTYAYACSILRL
jgi:hypothetical protein